MLYVIVADNKTFRKDRLTEVLELCGGSELITVDDATMTLADLEQFLYPSLFSIEVPVVHGTFFLRSDEIELPYLKQLAASPTVFIFEELTLPVADLTLLKKAGAIVHVGEKQKKEKPTNDIFAATLCITAKDKKSRWVAYRAALNTHPIEAILGILYWKVRTLASKGQAGNIYEKLYSEMLDAQSRAWQTGAPLDALIEKVILMQ